MQLFDLKKIFHIDLNTLHTNYIFQWKDDVLFIKISNAISRTTGPNIGLFVFISFDMLIPRMDTIFAENFQII